MKNQRLKLKCPFGTREVFIAFLLFQHAGAAITVTWTESNGGVDVVTTGFLGVVPIPTVGGGNSVFVTSSEFASGFETGGGGGYISGIQSLPVAVYSPANKSFVSGFRYDIYTNTLSVMNGFSGGAFSSVLRFGSNSLNNIFPNGFVEGMTVFDAAGSDYDVTFSHGSIPEISSILLCGIGVCFLTGMRERKH